MQSSQIMRATLALVFADLTSFGMKELMAIKLFFGRKLVLYQTEHCTELPKVDIGSLVQPHFSPTRGATRWRNAMVVNHRTCVLLRLRALFVVCVDLMSSSSTKHSCILPFFKECTCLFQQFWFVTIHPILSSSLKSWFLCFVELKSLRTSTRRLT